MLRKGKKLISKLLFLAMCTSLVPTTIAFGEEKDNIQETITNVVQTTGAAASVNQSDFEFDGDTGTITKYIGSETEVVIPSEINGVEVKNIGDSAFSSSSNLSNCNSIKKITIPDSVTSIGNSAFKDCSSLTSITIPDNITSIKDNTFLRCSSLSNITIPENVVSIGNDAFHECKRLMSITIPNSVTSIGEDAFYCCQGLLSIKIPKNVRSIGRDPFWADRNLEKISVDESNTSYKSIDGVLYSKDGTEIIKYPEGKSGENYTIADGVKNIGSNTFCYAFALKNITIPNSVTSINKYGFFDCTSLKSVTIPDSVTNFGDYAFASCSNLKNITILGNITSVANNAFDECNNSIIFGVKNEETKQLLIKSGISDSRIKIGTDVTIPIIETTITLDNTDLNLNKGNTAILTATVLPSTTTNAAVTWESSDTSVAIVNANGEVTAVGAGNATITCTVSDGSGKSSMCNVTVNSLLDRKILNDEISYAQGVVNKLNDAISAAKAVADNSSATETDINNAAEALKQADESLAKELQSGILVVTSINMPSLTTTSGRVPTLPTTVDIVFSDGTTTSSAVTWNKVATEATTYMYAGGVGINGTLEAYNNELVYGYVIISLPVGQTETNSEIDLSLCAGISGSGIPLGTTKIFFKLNVDNQEDYNVIVRGNTAMYDAPNKQFAILVNGSDVNFNSFKFIPSDFIVTKI